MLLNSTIDFEWFVAFQEHRKFPCLKGIEIVFLLVYYTIPFVFNIFLSTIFQSLTILCFYKDHWRGYQRGLFLCIPFDLHWYFVLRTLYFVFVWLCVPVLIPYPVQTPIFIMLLMWSMFFHYPFIWNLSMLKWLWRKVSNIVNRLCYFVFLYWVEDRSIHYTKSTTHLCQRNLVWCVAAANQSEEKMQKEGHF